MTSLLALAFLCCLISLIPISPSALHGLKLQLGSVEATPKLYNITFYINTTLGALTFNQTRYQNGSIASYPVGNYTAEALSDVCLYCPTFHHWNSTGGVQIWKPTYYLTNVTITSNGTLTAKYHFYTPTPIQPSSLLMGVTTALIAMIVLRRRFTHSFLKRVR